jgi:hypothetical protein
MPEAKTKLVNGVRVALTPEEKAEIEAEWAAEDLKPAPDPFEQTTINDPVISALVEEIASRVGATSEQLKAAIKARWESK